LAKERKLLEEYQEIWISVGRISGNPSKKTGGKAGKSV
jgi:hypothetical protein